MSTTLASGSEMHDLMVVSYGDSYRTGRASCLYRHMPWRLEVEANSEPVKYRSVVKGVINIVRVLKQELVFC